MQKVIVQCLQSFLPICWKCVLSLSGPQASWARMESCCVLIVGNHCVYEAQQLFILTILLFQGSSMYQVDWWWLQTDPYFGVSCWSHSHQWQLPPPYWRWVQLCASFWPEVEISYLDLPFSVWWGRGHVRKEMKILSCLWAVQKCLISIIYVFGSDKCQYLSLHWVLMSWNCLLANQTWRLC